MHLFIFFYWRAHQNLSQDLVYLKQHNFYQNNLIIPIHLSQVKHIFLNLCAYLACPKLIWTVTWRDLMQVLSSNEFLRGRIRKERPFFSPLLIFWGVFFFPLFFFCCCFFQGDPGQLGVHFLRGLSPAGRASNYTRERGWGFRLMNCRKWYYGYVLGKHYESSIFIECISAFYEFGSGRFFGYSCTWVKNVIFGH